VLYGAMSALGQALARTLAAGGFQVACPVTQQTDVDVLASIDAVRVIPSLLAAMLPDMIEEYIQTLRTHAGGLQACILIPALRAGGCATDGSLEDWEAMFQQDLWVPLLVGRAVLTAMQDQQPPGGHLVVINPVGRATLPDDPVYCGLSWGLAAFAEAVRLTYTGDAIRVTVLETAPAYLTAPAPPADAAVGDALLAILTQPARVSISELVLQPVVGPPPGGNNHA
jgi:NADP-dependent 3-hydroxy acid dehydrogenase YdfG